MHDSAPLEKKETSSQPKEGRFVHEQRLTGDVGEHITTKAKNSNGEHAELPTRSENQSVKGERKHKVTPKNEYKPFYMPGRETAECRAVSLEKTNNKQKFLLVEEIDKENPEKVTMWIAKKTTDGAKDYTMYALDAQSPFLKISLPNEPERRVLRVYDKQGRLKYFDQSLNDVWDPEDIGQNGESGHTITSAGKETYAEGVKEPLEETAQNDAVQERKTEAAVALHSTDQLQLVAKALAMSAEEDQNALLASVIDKVKHHEHIHYEKTGIPLDDFEIGEHKTEIDQNGKRVSKYDLEAPLKVLSTTQTLEGNLTTLSIKISEAGDVQVAQLAPIKTLSQEAEQQPNGLPAVDNRADRPLGDVIKNENSNEDDEDGAPSIYVQERIAELGNIPTKTLLTAKYVNAIDIYDRTMSGELTLTEGSVALNRLRNETFVLRHTEPGLTTEAQRLEKWIEDRGRMIYVEYRRAQQSQNPDQHTEPGLTNDIGAINTLAHEGLGKADGNKPVQEQDDKGNQLREQPEQQQQMADSRTHRDNLPNNLADPVLDMLRSQLHDILNQAASTDENNRLLPNEEREELQNIRSEIFARVRQEPALRAQAESLLREINARTITARQEERRQNTQQAPQPQNTPETPAQPGQDLESALAAAGLDPDELRDMGLDFDSSRTSLDEQGLIRDLFQGGGYSEQRFGTIYKSGFIGFETVSDYAQKNGVARTEFFLEFNRRYRRLVNPTASEDVPTQRSNEYRAFEIDLRKALADANAEDVKIVYKYRRGEPKKAGELGPIIGASEAEVQVFKNNAWTPLEGSNLVFNVNEGNGSDRLIVVQHVIMEIKQQRWLEERLNQATRRASNEDEWTQAKRDIDKNSQFFISDRIDRYYDDITMLYTAKQRFRTNGSLMGKEFREHAHQLMQLPGVAEIMAEIDKREFEMAWKYNENGQVVAIDKKEKEAEMLASAEGEGGMNLTTVGDLDNDKSRLRYDKIVTSLVKNATIKYDEWKTTKGIPKLQEAIDAERDPEIKFQLQQRLESIKNQVPDYTSVQVAEWLWRMSGRAAFFGDQSNGSQQQFEVINFGKWAVDKQKSRGNAYILNEAFGTASRDQRDKFPPGMMGGANLHTGWYGFFTDYAIFSPGEQIKGNLVAAGISKYIDPKQFPDDERILADIKKKFGEGGKLQKLSQQDALANLSPEERQVIARWHFAPTMQISEEIFQNIRDNQEVWNDWDDYDSDFKKAVANNGQLVDFLTNPDTKTLNDIGKKYWNRAWKFKGEGARRGMQTMLEYRTKYNRSMEGLRNLDAHDVDQAIITAVEAGVISTYNKRPLEDRMLGSRAVIAMPWPISIFRKDPMVMHFGKSLGLGYIWAGKYEYIPRRHIIGFIGNSISYIYKNWKQLFWS